MKYIVYETTNLVNNKIYIGLHKTINPDVFDGYLGCGCLVTQPNTYMNPKTHFQYAVKKYGPKNFKRKVLAIFDTLQEASDLERELVNEQFLSRPDVYNIVLGGIDGAMQFKIPVYQYDLEGNFIAKYESVSAASEAFNCHHTLIGHAVHRRCKAKGYYWNQDKVDKLDLSTYNNGNNHQIKIYCYLENGSFYKEYFNQTQASKDLNISTSLIKDSRLFGIKVKNYYFCTVKADSFDIARKEYVDNRNVYKYDSVGNFIQSYDTQLEAEMDNLGSNIAKSIKLKQPCVNGFLWGLEKLENYNKPKSKKRKVGQYDLNGNLIKEWSSATAAEKEFGTSVWKVLNGINKTQKGFIFKYLS